jgi:hypothetical protein
LFIRTRSFTVPKSIRRIRLHERYVILERVQIGERETHLRTSVLLRVSGWTSLHETTRVFNATGRKEGGNFVILSAAKDLALPVQQWPDSSLRSE